VRDRETFGCSEAVDGWEEKTMVITGRDGMVFKAIPVAVSGGKDVELIVRSSTGRVEAVMKLSPGQAYDAGKGLLAVAAEAMQ
jgi:hypothetical protein